MIRAHDEAMLELAALRAIGALEADEAALIDEHMRECAACREEFARSTATGGALAFAASAPPPESLRRRVLSMAVKIRRIRPWYRRTAAQAAIAAAIAIVAMGSWFALHRSAPAQQWALQCTGAAPAHCGDVVASGASLRIDTHGLPVPPAGKVYQAWIIHPAGKPIPEPTFTVTAAGDGSAQLNETAGKGDVVAVTVEPQGGSQAPTTKPFAVATLN